jgi:hypothetical protein
MKTSDTEFIQGVYENKAKIAMKFGHFYVLSMGSCGLLRYVAGPFSVAASKG